MLDHASAATAENFFAQPESIPETLTHRARFDGKGGEFFGIWIVNVLLTIVTFGLYSAWAKVRTERYFYANTTLAGSRFDYLASPIALFKGHLIAMGLVLAITLSSQFNPALSMALLAGVGLLTPVLLVLSLRFRARNSAWRGLSFRFDGGTGEAYGPFFLWQMLTSLSATLLFPIMKRRQHEFLVEGHRFGTRRFRFVPLQSYYAPYVAAAAIYLVAIIALVVAMGSMLDGGGRPSPAQSATFFAVMVPVYLAIFFVAIFLRVRYTNLLWNSTRIDHHRFKSTLQLRHMVWLYVSNGVLMLVTLGLATPWAMVRLARYRAECFALVTQGSLDDYVAASNTRPGATGAEIVDALDLGMDIGL